MESNERRCTASSNAWDFRGPVRLARLRINFLVLFPGFRTKIEGQIVPVSCEQQRLIPVGSGREVSLGGEETMFETLDDQIKHDDEAASSKTERMMPWLIAIVGAVVILGGLVVAVRLIQ